MDRKKFERGQAFSLDFVIAMSLAVLAIGMLLNNFETITYSEKEARLQNELAVIALNASSLMLELNRCTPSGTPDGPIEFIDQGYRLYGCSNPDLFQSRTKADLMVPTFTPPIKCNITWGNNRTKQSFQLVGADRCADAVPATGEIISIDRNFLSRASALAKADYEKCIDSNIDCSGVYGDFNLTVKVWR